MKAFLRIHIILLLLSTACLFLPNNYVAQCNVTVLPATSNTLCLGSSLELTVQADSGSTFQWSPATDLSNTNNDTVTVTPSSAGTITYLLIATDTVGCIDSVYVDVITNSPSSNTLTQTACDSYTLNGQSYTTSGTYTQTLTNSVGCDSTITLNLTVNYSTSSSITQIEFNLLSADKIGHFIFYAILTLLLIC